VTSVSAASAVLGRPLMERDETLTVLPGTLPPEVLAAKLATTDSAAIMKLGRTFPDVREALAQAGRLDDAWYVERATTDRERHGKIADIDPSTVPYFSLALLPSPAASAFVAAPAPQNQIRDPGEQTASPRKHTPASHGHEHAPHGQATMSHEHEPHGQATTSHEHEPAPHGQATTSHEHATHRQATTSHEHVLRPQATISLGHAQYRRASAVGERGGQVTVIGLGPAGRDWLTPEAQEALAAADDVVGYGPYVDRVPPNPRQRRHPSDNRVEAERAAFALDLAKRGSRVAVVSSGDPGVFAMAAAVLEVSEDPQWKDVPVRIVPGLTAAQAVASRVGAPLGHDFCILSLSDRLKPWEVIESRLAAAAGADLVIAIYNPASQSRKEQLVRAKALLLEHRTPATPVVVGRDVGGPQESVRVTTLGDLDPATIDMRCLLIVGSSQTRVATRGDGTTQVYTPRNYPA